jgi:hypothetical protein
MSTYLALVNNVLDRLNEVNLDSSSFSSARGIHSAAKLGVKNAINRINSQKWEWPFNYATATKTLSIGINIYAFEADYKIADWESFYIVAGTYGSQTIKTQRLVPIQRQEWYKWHRDRDLDNAVAGREFPKEVFWNSNQQFGVTPVPDQAYVINYNYWKTTTDLSLYSDTITIPENFNWVIEQGALEDMYVFLDNDQRAALGSVTFKDAISQMARILIPQDISNRMRDTRVNFSGDPFYSYGRTSNPML